MLWIGNGSMSKTAKPTLCGGSSGHERGLKSCQILCSGDKATSKLFDYQLDKPSFAFAKIENNRVLEIQV